VDRLRRSAAHRRLRRGRAPRQGSSQQGQRGADLRDQRRQHRQGTLAGETLRQEGRARRDRAPSRDVHADPAATRG
jgi:hypothetical protein